MPTHNKTRPVFSALKKAPSVSARLRPPPFGRAAPRCITCIIIHPSSKKRKDSFCLDGDLFFKKGCFSIENSPFRSAAPAVIAAPHNEYLLIYELRGRLNAALNPILCGGTTKVCHRYFSAKFCSMTATWARVALSSGLRSIRSASELDSRPAPTAQATASPPQLATAAASS